MAGEAAGGSIWTTYRPSMLGWRSERSRSFGGAAQAVSAIARIAVGMRYRDICFSKKGFGSEGQGRRRAYPSDRRAGTQQARSIAASAWKPENNYRQARPLT